MSMSRLGFGVLSLVGLTALGSGCSPRNQYTPPPPPPVEVSLPVQREVTEYRQFTGTTAAKNTAEVYARVRGFLLKMHFAEGDLVEAGDLLYTIDDREFRAEVDQAAAAVATAEATLELQKSTLQRLEKALETNAVSELQVIESRARRDQATAQLDAAKAGLARAELDLEYTRITAPISGKVGYTRVDPGNLVQPNEQLLTTIMDYKPIYAVFDMQERDVLELIEKNPSEQRSGAGASPESYQHVVVEIGLETDAGYPHAGNLQYVDQAVGSGTGTLLMRARFDNEDLRIFPGLFARVRIPFETKLRLLVPEKAIGRDQGGPFVYTVNAENIVEQKAVALGSRQGQLRVILSGLGANDRVIVEGTLRARPGAKVTPKPAAPESSPDSPAGG